MKQFRFTALALASLAALAACSENPAGPIAPDAVTVKPTATAALVSTTVCSAAGTGGWVAENTVWANPNGFAGTTGSAWIVPQAGYGNDAPPTGGPTQGPNTAYPLDVTLPAIPSTAINVSLTGSIMYDNFVTLKLNANATPVYEDLTSPTGGNYAGPPASFASTTQTFNLGSANILHFTVWNELDPFPNPVGVDFCVTVNYDLPVVTGGQGCTLGYWKNHTTKWTTYSSGQSFASVFGATHNPYGTNSLLAVLQTGGGGLANLGRQTVAALLNASSGISFGETTAQVIADFQAVYPGTGTPKQKTDAQAALATKFEGMTDAVAPNVCPLN